MIYNPQTGWTEPSVIHENTELIDYVAQLQTANNHLNEAINTLRMAHDQSQSSSIKLKIEKLGQMLMKIQKQGIPHIIHSVANKSEY